MLNGYITPSLPLSVAPSLSLSPPLFQPFPYFPTSQRLYGNGRGVIERRFVRGDLNVFLCVLRVGKEGGVPGSSVLFGFHSAKEA